MWVPKSARRVDVVLNFFYVGEGFFKFGFCFEFSLEEAYNVFDVSFEEFLSVWVFGCHVLGPVYDEDVLVWLEDYVVGAEVGVDYASFLIGFTYVD